MSEIEMRPLVDVFKEHSHEADELSERLNTLMCDHHIIASLMAMGAVIGTQLRESEDATSEYMVVLLTAIQLHANARGWSAELKKRMN